MMRILLYCALFCSVASGQAVHPFLLFDASDVGLSGPLRTRLLSTCSASNPADTPLPCCYSALPSSVTAALPAHWDVQNGAYDYVNQLLAVALRYQVELRPQNLGDQGVAKLCELLFGSSAALATWQLSENPLSGTHGIQARPFKWPSFVISIALCYDWLHGHAHASFPSWEIHVREFLETCAYAMLEGQIVGTDVACPIRHLGGYRDACNNNPQGWMAGACFSLLALHADNPSWRYTSAEWQNYNSSTLPYSPNPSMPYILGDCSTELLAADPTPRPTGKSPVYPNKGSCVSGNSRHFDETLTGAYGAMYFEWANSPTEMITKLLDEFESAFKDVVNPGGWCEEEQDYANVLSWGVLAGIAAKRNNLGANLVHRNIFSAGNAYAIPRWIGASFIPYVGYPFAGDFSLGSFTIADRLNPIWYWLANDLPSDTAFHGLEQIRDHMRNPTSNLFDPGYASNQYLRWLDPNVLFCILYDPTTPFGVPRVSSYLCKDTQNLAPLPGTPWTPTGAGHADKNLFANRTDGPGAVFGGRFHLHNSPKGAEGPVPFLPMDIEHIVKREWLSHGHEDSGHVSISYAGERFFVDRGRQQIGGGNLDYIYGASNTQPHEGAQNFDHNVMVQISQVPPVSTLPEPFNIEISADYANNGATGGTASNSFESPNGGEFADRIVASALGEGCDYVRSEHKDMWRMTGPDARADRHILFVKHYLIPYVFLIDDVKDDTPRVFQQNWWSYHPAGGVPGATAPPGTFANPIEIAGVNPGAKLYSFWIEPPSVATYFSPTHDSIAGTGIDTYFNRVRSAMPASASATFISLHTNLPTHSPAFFEWPLTAIPPGGDTLGHRFQWYFVQFQDVIAYSRTQNLQCGEASGDARILWYRHDGLLPWEWIATDVLSQANIIIPVGGASLVYNALSASLPVTAASLRYPTRDPFGALGSPVVEVQVDGMAGNPTATIDLLTGVDIVNVYVNGAHWSVGPFPGLPNVAITKAWLASDFKIRLTLTQY